MEEQDDVPTATTWIRATQLRPLRRAVFHQPSPQAAPNATTAGGGRNLTPTTTANPQTPPTIQQHQLGGDSNQNDSLRKRAVTSPQTIGTTTTPPTTTSISSASSTKSSSLTTSSGEEQIKLIEAIRTPATLELFSAFLKQIHSQENLNFWTAVENYKKLSNKEALAGRAKELVRLYLEDNAAEQVNIDGKLRNEILSRINREVDQNLFDSAQRSVFRTMEMDSFPKFLRSPVYQKFKEGRRSTLLANEREEPAPPPYADSSFFSYLKEGSYGKRTRTGDMLPRTLWMSEDESSNCSACSDSFTHLRRRHHCRHCGMLYCSDCSSRKWTFVRPERGKAKEQRRTTTVIPQSPLLSPDLAVPSEGPTSTCKERVCHNCYALLEGLQLVQPVASLSLSDVRAQEKALSELKPHILTLTAYLVCPFPTRQVAALHTLARMEPYIKRGLVVEDIANSVLRYMGLAETEGRSVKTPPPSPLGESLALEVLASCLATSNTDACRALLQGETAKLIGRMPRMLCSTQANDDVTLAGCRLLFNAISCDASAQVRQMHEKGFLLELLDLLASCHNKYALGLLVGTVHRIIEDNEDYVELVLSKSSATRTLSDLLSLRHPMKTLTAALYGCKFWAVVAEGKSSGHIYGEGNLLRFLMKIAIAEGLDSDIVEASASALANLSYHEGQEVLCSDKVFLGEFITLLKHYSDGVKRQVARMLQNVCVNEKSAASVLELQGLSLLKSIRTYDEELQRYVTEAILQLETHL